MKAIVLDFEATDTSEDAQATEIAVMDVVFNNGLFTKEDDVGIRSNLCLPERPISFGAMAVTSIFTEDLQHCDSHTAICAQMMPTGKAYVIGHNVDFDIRVAANAGVDVSQYKVICTLAMVRSLYPDADSHTLGAMSCMLDYEYARENMKNAHGAAADVVMTARLLHKICKQQNITSMDQLYEFSEFARIPTHFPFGKHKGVAIAELATNQDGRGYLQWVVNSIKDNEYLTTACKKALNN
ncbi:MAG: exonuclease domain-containing protein [Psychrobacter alimentarius]